MSDAESGAATGTAGAHETEQTPVAPDRSDAPEAPPQRSEHEAAGAAEPIEVFGAFLYHMLLTLIFMAIGGGVGWFLGLLSDGWTWRTVAAVFGTIYVLFLSGIEQVESSFDVVRIVLSWASFVVALLFP